MHPMIVDYGSARTEAIRRLTLFFRWRVLPGREELSGSATCWGELLELCLHSAVVLVQKVVCETWYVLGPSSPFATKASI